MKATANLYEQHSGFLSSPLFYSQAFGGHAHSCATRCTALAKQLIQLAAGLRPHSSPRAEGKSKNISSSSHYSTDCSNAKLLHLIRDGNPPLNAGQGAPQNFEAQTPLGTITAEHSMARQCYRGWVSPFFLPLSFYLFVSLQPLKPKSH